ncbi:uncharacterized protein LACBIDRAFT_298892 [Laccaria bicolor S238N-H82]|uniref:Predicted protein n=1 Tax=Laccaria bicolor (strain S238N-H82 / ATCC MYA-4686) TaxID=486041 RepID=B0DE89_LACBS|nr:uncharacterized protein LACBIDRAFT_298892 [Laccaria bicolor S238N-H82]EDR07224.1 predicted protein [Laccaria bicolor S238N-H82]|eukprot:XP_001882155.1 predicted protein [Laccaria bicolor S238N-H82]
MGFPTFRCLNALLVTGNSDAEAAMESLFSHMDDPDIDKPIQAAQSVGGSEPSPGQRGPRSTLVITLPTSGLTANGCLMMRM